MHYVSVSEKETRKNGVKPGLLSPPTYPAKKQSVEKTTNKLKCTPAPASSSKQSAMWTKYAERR